MPVSTPVSFSVGVSYAFDYPRHNFHGIKSSFERRHVHVTEVRDLMERPLDPMTGEESPLLRRGQILITGQDLDKGLERSFYADSMVNVELLQEERQTA